MRSKHWVEIPIGILYAPDYVFNVGGAMALPGMEVIGWSGFKTE
jgi:glutamate dehydrogenase/leucine dehydrogenase